ncbi:MAG: hypothetical protein IT521_10690 [Burkholderiales bacterium]|nr:hypothetical protein [Burkholderiales bacterium]
MPDLTFQDVLDILRLIDSGQFQELEIEFDGTRVKVTRHTGTTAGGTGPATESVGEVMQPPEPATVLDAQEQGAGPKAGDAQPSTSKAPAQRPLVEIPNRIDVKPPMAGTYYAAPAPNAAPFVDVDRRVRKGDSLGIVEVMKLFTPVLAPCDGTVRLIFVNNEEFVQSDQTLMVMQADA